WGPMGEHVAVDWSGNAGAQSMGIWMTTTGGLDDLHSGINMTDSNGAPLMQQDTFNVPWELTSTCNPYLIPIALSADVDGLSEKVSLYDSLGDVALLGQTSIDLPIRQEDTIWMMYDPHHPVINAELTFQNHWHCSDWTETRTVHIDAIPKALINSPLLFFAGCLPDTEAAIVHLDSCQTLSVDSIAIPPSIAAGLHLITSLPDTASVGVGDSLFFRLTPSDTFNSLSDSITVYAHYLGLDSILDDYFYFPHASGVDTDFSLFSATIPIGFEYPAAWELALSAPDSANAGGTVTFQIIQHDTLPPDDTSVDFQLVFYDDLLTLNTVDERWASIVGHYRDANGMAHYHLHFSMPVTDSILATIHLTAYQARELTTSLSFDSVHFASNPSRASDCIASAVLDSSEFTIRTSCDGPLLSEALNGLLTIDGVSPNPTSGELLLRYTLRGVPVEGIIELEDALGRNVLEQTAPLLPGPNQSIALDLSKLPAGMYLARLALTGTTRSDVRSERIIKE
ncbi:MAG TPA: T9SS type A sorting domain-containing protein, partial [Candidatus Kapabacteria bacterium]|nr:T9SS type A sorting domain-containing protein [Candidatus Kapabacteria bacterium]